MLKLKFLFFITAFAITPYLSINASSSIGEENLLVADISDEVVSESPPADVNAKCSAILDESGELNLLEFISCVNEQSNS